MSTRRETKEEKSSAIDAHQIDAYESRRCRINQSDKQGHEEHTADRGHNSMSLYTLVHLPILIPEAMKKKNCQLDKNPK